MTWGTSAWHNGPVPSPWRVQATPHPLPMPSRFSWWRCLAPATRLGQSGVPLLVSAVGSWMALRRRGLRQWARLHCPCDGQECRRGSHASHPGPRRLLVWGTCEAGSGQSLGRRPCAGTVAGALPWRVPGAALHHKVGGWQARVVWGWAPALYGRD